MTETMQRLKQSFSDGYVDLSNTFVAHRNAHRTFGRVCFDLNKCYTAQDVIAAAIEQLSYDCFKSAPFKTPAANDKFRDYMLKGLNSFLRTEFKEQDIRKIYYRLGNGINHKLTMEFIASGYDLKVLKAERVHRVISADLLLEAINNVEYRAKSLEKTAGGNDVLRRLMPQLIAAQPTVNTAGQVCQVRDTPCHSCENYGWSMPQCRACNAINGFRYYRARKE